MIDLYDVSLQYVSPVERVTALDHVSLSVHQGEFVALVGASGSGKSTLINAIAGLQRVESGRVQVDGDDIQSMSDEQLAHLRLTKIGVVFQDDNLIPEFSAAENIELPLRARGVDHARANVEAERALVQVGLEGLGRRMPAQLSGGQRQRVGIARALVGGRSVLLADEPTGALDSQTSAAIFGLLRQLADSGVAVIVASHDLSVRAITDQTLVMRDGRLHGSAMRGGLR